MPTALSIRHPPASANTAAQASFSGTPIYVQLVTLFRRRIESGSWPVGQQIPTLDALTAELGVARATIRHAIGFLEREGLIGRFRRRGTFVLKRPDSEVWHDIPLAWSTLTGEEPDIRTEWLASHPAAEPPTPSHPGGRTASAYQFMRRLHRRHSIAYLIGTAWMERSLFRAIGKAALSTPAPLKVLQRALGARLGRAEQTIQVATADLEVARLLDVPINSAVVVVSRSVFDRDAVLLYESEGHYRGDFVRIRTRLR